MRKTVIAVALLLCPLAAEARKSCDELKTEIEAKLSAKSVSGYTLSVLPMSATAEGRVVGSCEGNTQQIVYARGTAAAQAAAAEPAAPTP